MRNFFLLLFLAILLVSVLFVGLDWNRFNERTKIIAVHYYAENCRECRELEHKMRKIAWVYARSPIVFLTYDQSNAERKSFSEKKLSQVGILSKAREVGELRLVMLYEVKTGRQVARIYSGETITQIDQKIRKLLKIKGSPYFPAPIVN